MGKKNVEEAQKQKKIKNYPTDEMLHVFLPWVVIVK